MQFQNEKEKVLIVDFGSQVTKLIARRIRELGVFSEIITPKELVKIKQYHSIKGFILSGGPSTVTNSRFQRIPKEIFEKKIPVLGICYGLQLIAKLFGGKIKSSKKRREFGRAFLFKKKNSLLTKKYLITKKTVWMSHQDAVVKLPKNFKSIASTQNSKLTIIEHSKKKIYGVQFHPEVTHTENGKQIFKNFLFLICKIKKKWNISSQKKKINQEDKKSSKKR
jgi:GMP synthase (glutamine-hydrolysing)